MTYESCVQLILSLSAVVKESICKYVTIPYDCKKLAICVRSIDPLRARSSNGRAQS